MKGKIAALSVALITVGTVAFASPAVAETEGITVPSEFCTADTAVRLVSNNDYVEAVEEVSHVEVRVVTEAYDEVVVISAAVNQWYSWNGSNTDTAPAFPGELWNPDNGNHNGFGDAVNVAIRSQGNSENAS